MKPLISVPLNALEDILSNICVFMWINHIMFNVETYRRYIPYSYILFFILKY